MFSRLAPNAVITLGSDGVYGHADHLAVTEAVDRASQTFVSAPLLLHTLFPIGLFARVRSSLERAIDVPLAHRVTLGGDTSGADLTLPLDSELAARKRAALAAHASQLVGRDPLTFLGTGVAAALLRCEWYSRRAGPMPP
jgi:N-acetyl-1-D-myo-inositol-2-amino-2-deoxy-alpha-D-glucopyranoside deacetylase